jgi:hypothetical protein
MQYNTAVDAAIVNELNRNGSCSYLKLKRKIDKYLRRNTSFDTYNHHIKKLQMSKLLTKNSSGKRGEPIFYSLTEEARLGKRLKILYSTKFVDLRLSLYGKLFFYEVSPPDFVPCDYRSDLPGVSVSEFMKNDCIYYGFINRSDVEKELKKALKLLTQFGLFKSMSFGNEIRYMAANERLQELIKALKKFHRTEFLILLYKWEGLEEPTRQETKRMNWLLGRKEVSKMFYKAAIARENINKINIRKETIEEYDQCLKDNAVYEYELGNLDIEFKVYKERVAVGDARDNITEFKKFRRERLRGSEQRLMQYAENIKMNYIDIIQKYTFLNPATETICPHIFPPRRILSEYEYPSYPRSYPRSYLDYAIFPKISDNSELSA